MIICISLVSCTKSREEWDSYKNERRLIKLHEVMIDSCEYIENGATYNYAYSLTHKGNCKNPIHKCPCDTVKIK